MSHPSACGVSADDVAVLVHGDLLAIGQGHGIAAIHALGSGGSVPAKVSWSSGGINCLFMVFSFPHFQMVRVL